MSVRRGLVLLLGLALLGLSLPGCLVVPGDTSQIALVSTSTVGGWRYDYYRNNAYRVRGERPRDIRGRHARGFITDGECAIVGLDARRWGRLVRRQPHPTARRQPVERGVGILAAVRADRRRVCCRTCAGRPRASDCWPCRTAIATCTQAPGSQMRTTRIWPPINRCTRRTVCRRPRLRSSSCRPTTPRRNSSSTAQAQVQRERCTRVTRCSCRRCRQRASSPTPACSTTRRESPRTSRACAATPASRRPRCRSSPTGAIKQWPTRTTRSTSW